MWFNKSITGAVLCSLLLALLVAGCGGGGSSITTPNQPDQGNGAIPGQQTGGDGGGSGVPGTGGGGSGAGSNPGGYPEGPDEYDQFRVKLAGVSGEAPLGLDTSYQPELVGGTVESFEPYRAGSAVIIDPPTIQIILDSTIVDDGATPDWGVEQGLFAEGEQIDLYLQYQVPGPGTYSRHWKCPDLGLDFLESNIQHNQSGQYEIKLDYVIPWGITKQDAKFDASIISSTETVNAPVFEYDIISGGLGQIVYYPSNPDEQNDQQGNWNDYQGGGCIPQWIDVDFNGTSAAVTSTKDLSNVVLLFADNKRQKWDNLTGHTGTFYGTGSNTGKQIIGVWVKSGCNASGDGPGYGEYFHATDGFNDVIGMAQMNFEDMLTSSDYDYNDFVGRMNVREFRDEAGDLVQIQMTVKAVARAAGFDGDWQFNIDGAFPGAKVVAVVNQYYANGQRHGNQRVWKSNSGASVPIFTPVRTALPNPPGTNITNGIAGTKFIDGDYAEVTIVFDDPVAAGSYTPMPYEPQLKVFAGQNYVYNIGLWEEKGDFVDSNGRPLAFIIPDTYAWPLEGKKIWYSYPGYNTWIAWMNDMTGTLPEPNPTFWDTAPVVDYFKRSLFTN